MDDQELAHRLARGDNIAKEELVERYHAEVYRFLRHLTRHTQEAEDLTQLTLLKVIDRAAKYQPTGAFRSWVLGIAFREFTSWRRRRLWLPILGDRPDPADPYSDLAEAEALLDALRTLPTRTRAVFLLHYVEELTVAEVAESLGIAEGTVKSRLFQARKQLRHQLTEDSYVPETC